MGLDECTWLVHNLWDAESPVWPYVIAVRWALPVESMRFSGGFISHLMELNRNCYQAYRAGETQKPLILTGIARNRDSPIDRSRG